MDNYRMISQIVIAKTTTGGERLFVHRPFPNIPVQDFDPFIQDEMSALELHPNQAKGAAEHPNRGFETVKYVIDYVFEHKDSKRIKGKILAGGVQWMTAKSELFILKCQKKILEKWRWIMCISDMGKPQKIQNNSSKLLGNLISRNFVSDIHKWKG